jgi:hypothetical protein
MPGAKAKKKPWNNTVVAILHLTNLCIGLAICFFVAEYQRSELSALNVSNEEIEGNPQLQKWSADDNHCIIMFDQLVAIGATIGGIAAVSCLFGLFAVCARPARKCLHFFGLGLTISMWITAIGFGIAMLIDYNNDHVIFNSGYGSGCYVRQSILLQRFDTQQYTHDMRYIPTFLFTKFTNLKFCSSTRTTSQAKIGFPTRAPPACPVTAPTPSILTSTRPGLMHALRRWLQNCLHDVVHKMSDGHHVSIMIFVILNLFQN